MLVIDGASNPIYWKITWRDLKLGEVHTGHTLSHVVCSMMYIVCIWRVFSRTSYPFESLKVCEFRLHGISEATRRLAIWCWPSPCCRARWRPWKWDHWCGGKAFLMKYNDMRIFPDIRNIISDFLHFQTRRCIFIRLDMQKQSIQTCWLQRLGLLFHYVSWFHHFSPPMTNPLHSHGLAGYLMVVQVVKALVQEFSNKAGKY